MTRSCQDALFRARLERAMGLGRPTDCDQLMGLAHPTHHGRLTIPDHLPDFYLALRDPPMSLDPAP